MNQISIDEEYGSVEGYVVSSQQENVENFLLRYCAESDVRQLMSWMRSLDLTCAVLKGMRVEDHVQGTGIGTRLLTSFVERCCEAQTDIIILEADVLESQREGFNLVAWYERHDFQQTGIKSADGGPIMLCVLNESAVTEFFAYGQGVGL